MSKWSRLLVLPSTQPTISCAAAVYETQYDNIIPQHCFLRYQIICITKSNYRPETDNDNALYLCSVDVVVLVLVPVLQYRGWYFVPVPGPEPSGPPGPGSFALPFIAAKLCALGFGWSLNGWVCVCTLFGINYHRQQTLRFFNPTMIDNICVLLNYKFKFRYSNSGKYAKLSNKLKITNPTK